MWPLKVFLFLNWTNLCCRPVPVVQPGPGGCSLFFPWKTVPSSQSWPWPPSRIASLPSEESSSLSLARGHDDGGAPWKNRSGIYAVQKRVRSFVGSLLDWFTLYVFTRSFSRLLLRQFILRCSFLCHVALPNACQFCWEYRVGHSAGMKVFLLSFFIQHLPTSFTTHEWTRPQHTSKPVIFDVAFSVL